MAEEDKKKGQYSWSVSHSHHIPPICMVQILGLKREIRIAFSLNGSIRLLKWNRNVIRNQCIRTCLDISTIPLHTLPSPSLRLYRDSPATLPSISFSLSIFIITTTLWRKRFGLSLNIQSCQSGHGCRLLTLGPPWK